MSPDILTIPTPTISVKKIIQRADFKRITETLLEQLTPKRSSSLYFKWEQAAASSRLYRPVRPHSTNDERVTIVRLVQMVPGRYAWRHDLVLTLVYRSNRKNIGFLPELDVYAETEGKTVCLTDYWYNDGFDDESDSPLSDESINLLNRLVSGLMLFVVEALANLLTDQAVYDC